MGDDVESDVGGCYGSGVYVFWFVVFSSSSFFSFLFFSFSDFMSETLLPWAIWMVRTTMPLNQGRQTRQSGLPHCHLQQLRKHPPFPRKLKTIKGRRRRTRFSFFLWLVALVVWRKKKHPLTLCFRGRRKPGSKASMV